MSSRRCSASSPCTRTTRASTSPPTSWRSDRGDRVRTAASGARSRVHPCARDRPPRDRDRTHGCEHRVGARLLDPRSKPVVRARGRGDRARRRRLPPAADAVPRTARESSGTAGNFPAGSRRTHSRHRHAERHRPTRGVREHGLDSAVRRGAAAPAPTRTPPAAPPHRRHRDRRRDARAHRWHRRSDAHDVAGTATPSATNSSSSSSTTSTTTATDNPTAVTNDNRSYTSSAQSGSTSAQTDTSSHGS